MPADLHETSLIALLAISFVLALLFGLLANRLRISPIGSYLVAGIAVGPLTPGFVGEALGASRAVIGERELAVAMTEHTLRGLGVPPERARVAAGRDPQVDPVGT